MLFKTRPASCTIATVATAERFVCRVDIQKMILKRGLGRTRISTHGADIRSFGSVTLSKMLVQIFFGYNDAAAMRAFLRFFSSVHIYKMQRQVAFNTCTEVAHGATIYSWSKHTVNIFNVILKVDILKEFLIALLASKTFLFSMYIPDVSQKIVIAVTSIRAFCTVKNLSIQVN